MLQYTTTKPEEVGVYACRVPLTTASGSAVLLKNDTEKLCDDVFLMWHESRWWYVGSSMAYRGDVVGWIGPLPRFNQRAENAETD